MIFCKELDKEFVTKEDLFKEVKANIDEIIYLKKSLIQKSCEKGSAILCKSLNGLKLNDAEKAAIQMEEGYYYIVVNSTNILDSHVDLHVKGIWNKSAQEQQGKNYLTTDHRLEMANIAVKKQYVEILIANVSFKSLGYPYEGNTQVLVYKVPKDKIINDAAAKWLESGDAIEASVCMQYINIMFAMDSNDPADEAEKKNYDDYIDSIANKADFEYIPYFFIIKEAKNVRESSLVVAGSNPVTGNIMRPKGKTKDIEPEQSTLTKIKDIDPTEVSQVKTSSNFYFTI